MDKLRIDGGQPLHGEVAASGAKNAALPLMAASLLSSRPVRLERAPALMDVHTLGELLRSMGAQVERDGASLN
ncbi:MAG: UDP-N-acetylglucosamine 1-carboxyvinyltransferase, partial [Betaproteobacteria bacterium]|nr:UDP-N-acetylglucosamine 1-carboxyvinyltransferase [Betaproteobacteria bacterium]